MNTQISNLELTSRTIDALRFPLAILIVLLHNNPLGIQVALMDNNKELYQQYEVYYAIQHLFTNDIARIAVPLFFFISGWLFYLKLGLSSQNKYPWGGYYLSKMGKSLKSVVIPYFVWNVIYILFNLMIQVFFSSYMKGSQTHYVDYTMNDWARFIWYPAGGHLLFLRDLFVVTVCSYPLYYLLRNRVLGFISILVLGLAWLLGAPNFFGIIGVESFFFWCCGAYVCLQRICISNVGKMQKPLVVVYFLVLFLELMLWHSDNNVFIYFERLGICVGLMTAVAVVSSILAKREVRVESIYPKSSLFIYLSHGIILLLICRAYVMFMPVNEITLILEYFIVPPIVAGFLVYIYKLMSKYMPNVLSIINGGRI